MANESKARNTFLYGIALCVISILLLIIGTVGLMSTDLTYVFVPMLFLFTGIFAILMSKRKKRFN